MKFTLMFVCVAVVAITATSGKPSKGSTKAALQKKPQCVQTCTDDYTPVCAGDGSGQNNKSFGNECVLRNHNCEHGSNLQIVSKGECPGGGGVRLS